MLRNRTRTVPSLMADHYRPQNTKPISAFLVSPRFRALTTMGLSEADSLMSPTSTLDSTQFLSPNPNPQNSFFDKTQIQKTPKSPESEPRGIGLALIEDPSKPRNCKVLFGSKLKIQIPKSSIFGHSKDTTQGFSLEEMELSEDYTCVTSHGPNPKIIHIFDNCVLERCSSVSSEKSGFCPPNNGNFISKGVDQKNDIFIFRGDEENSEF